MSVRSVLAVVALGLWASLAVHFPSASAQDSVCDSLLDNDVAGPWAYGQRKDRCEGLYVEQVSGAVLAVLAGIGLGRARLGVLGNMEWPFAGRKQRVLLPLRIGQGGGAAAEESYELVIRPGVELREIYLSLAAVGDDGTEQEYLIDEEALNYHYYPAERAVSVPLPPLSRAGLYYILIAAELASGADSTVEAYFHHPGG